MARTTIPVVTIPKNDSVALSFVAADATNEHEFLNDGKTFLRVENSVASINTGNITILGIEDEHGRDWSISVTVPAATGGSRLGRTILGPFPTGLYNAGGGTKCQVDVGTATGLRLAAFTYED